LVLIREIRVIPLTPAALRLRAFALNPISIRVNPRPSALKRWLFSLRHSPLETPNFRCLRRPPGWLSPLDPPIVFFVTFRGQFLSVSAVLYLEIIHFGEDFKQPSW
jgi:hypothetical protein